MSPARCFLLTEEWGCNRGRPQAVLIFHLIEEEQQVIMEKRRVLITGLGAITPLGHNADDTWQAVKDGVCGIGPITHYDCSAQKVHLAAEVKDWDPTTVLDKKDVRHMSRYIQLAMTAAKECLPTAA